MARRKPQWNNVLRSMIKHIRDRVKGDSPNLFKTTNDDVRRITAEAKTQRLDDKIRTYIKENFNLLENSAEIANQLLNNPIFVEDLRSVFEQVSEGDENLTKALNILDEHFEKKAVVVEPLKERKKKERNKKERTKKEKEPAGSQSSSDADQQLDKKVKADSNSFSDKIKRGAMAISDDIKHLMKVQIAPVAINYIASALDSALQGKIMSIARQQRFQRFGIPQEVLAQIIPSLSVRGPATRLWRSLTGSDEIPKTIENLSDDELSDDEPSDDEPAEDETSDDEPAEPLFSIQPEQKQQFSPNLKHQKPKNRRPLTDQITDTLRNTIAGFDDFSAEQRNDIITFANTFGIDKAVDAFRQMPSPLQATEEKKRRRRRTDIKSDTDTDDEPADDGADDDADDDAAEQTPSRSIPNFVEPVDLNKQWRPRVSVYNGGELKTDSGKTLQELQEVGLDIPDLIQEKATNPNHTPNNIMWKNNIQSHKQRYEYNFPIDTKPRYPNLTKTQKEQIRRSIANENRKSMKRLQTKHQKPDSGFIQISKSAFDNLFHDLPSKPQSGRVFPHTAPYRSVLRNRRSRNPLGLDASRNFTEIYVKF